MIRATRHRVGRLGWQLSTVAIFGLLGGAVQGLNLLVLVASMGLAVMLVQWRLSRYMIDSVRVDRRLPAEVFARRSVSIRYLVSNRSSWLPLWLIRIDDRIVYDPPPPPGGSGAAAEVRRLVRSVWRMGRTPVGQRFATAAGILRPGRSETVSVQLHVSRRGRYRLEPWMVSTVAPLSVTRAWRVGVAAAGDRRTLLERYLARRGAAAPGADRGVNGPVRLDVFPAPAELARDWRKQLPCRAGMNDQRSGGWHANADEFFGLREYRTGDNPKHIHWRTTARLGRPAIRQHEMRRSYRLCVVADVGGGVGADVRGGVGGGGQFDESVDEEILSLLTAILMAMGDGGDVSVAIPGSPPRWFPPGNSVAALSDKLRCLAAVDLQYGGSVGAALQHCIDAVGRGGVGRRAASQRLGDLLVLSSRSLVAANASERPERGGESGLEIAMRQWRGWGAIRWVDLSGEDRGRWIRPAADQPVGRSPLAPAGAGGVNVPSPADDRDNPATTDHPAAVGQFTCASTAAAAAFGGLIAGSSDKTEPLAVIAVLAAVVGYFLVDRWRLFALPGVIVYVALGLVSIYSSMGFFSNSGGPNGRHRRIVDRRSVGPAAADQAPPADRAVVALCDPGRDRRGGPDPIGQLWVLVVAAVDQPRLGVRFDGDRIDVGPTDRLGAGRGGHRCASAAASKAGAAGCGCPADRAPASVGGVATGICDSVGLAAVSTLTAVGCSGPATPPGGTSGPTRWRSPPWSACWRCRRSRFLVHGSSSLRPARCSPAGGWRRPRWATATPSICNRSVGCCRITKPC